MVARAMALFPHQEAGVLCCPNAPPPAWGPSEDHRSITTTFQYLETSGWYWGPTSVSEAQEALVKKPEGTFLMRDSSHPKHMLTLSVQTCCGPTSVRVDYSRGSFWLDSIAAGQPCTQTFPDVLSLVQFYASSGPVPQSQTPSAAHPKVKPEPAPDLAQGSNVALKLMHPLHKPGAFPSLRHLTRLTINRHASCPDQLPLPKPLLGYLQDYPFQV
uniref:Cytokine-inducible SH2-containing protein n=1 Tax=Tetraodon nigroviridis TaxID=99883 RepID=B0EVP2_TETNG|nr:suppressor of cytokine signaling 8 [Tetraodon nigroviridis]